MSENNEKDYIDPVPELSPELIAANDAFQELMREKFALPLSPDREKNLRIRVINDNLEVLRSLVAGEREAAGAEAKSFYFEKIRRLKDRTADEMAALGQFSAAASLAHSESLQEKYRAYDLALNLPDAEWCEHPTWARISEDENSQKIPVYYREFDFADAASGRNLSMIRCGRCGFRNARDLTRDLANISKNRAKICAEMDEKGIKTLAEAKAAGIETDITKLI